MQDEMKFVMRCIKRLAKAKDWFQGWCAWTEKMMVWNHVYTLKR